MWHFFLLATCCIVGVNEVYASGLDQFWADDFKVFEQIYGKTNDKDIYGATLPPPVNYGDLARETSGNKDLYPFNHRDDFREPYGTDDPYKDLLANKPFKKRKQPNFIGYSDFKPIGKNNDPETYKFLKHLDDADRDKRLFGSKVGHRHYYDYPGDNPENNDAYRSIQGILDAHENKKSKDRNDRRYSAKPSRAYSYGPPSKGKKCPTGRCTQKINTIRVRTGPYIEKGRK